MKKTIHFLLLIIFASSYLYGQDAQYSQIYASPLYNNPAFAGVGEYPRVIINWRKQWPSLDASFTTYSAGFDTYVSGLSGGVGVLVTRDQVSSTGFQSTEVGLQYAYEGRISYNWMLRAGMQASYTIRNSGLSSLRFVDQFNDLDGFTGVATQEAFDDVAINYFNLGAGVFLSNDRYWIGLAAHNLLQPNQSVLLTSTEDSKLPIRYTFQTGAKFYLTNDADWRLENAGLLPTISFTPAIQVRRQGSFMQFDAGLNFEYSPISVGVWYRGIPIRSNQNFLNNESIIGIVGFTWRNLGVGYSYDFTISSLGISETGGAHELSLIYYINPPTKYGTSPRTPRNNFPCPKY